MAAKRGGSERVDAAAVPLDDGGVESGPADCAQGCEKDGNCLRKIQIYVVFPADLWYDKRMDTFIRPVAKPQICTRHEQTDEVRH